MATHADGQIAAALERGDTATAERWQRIRARVDLAPPIDGALRDQLAVLLRPAVVDISPPAARARQRAA